MLQKIESYIRENNMLEEGDRVCVALSGGADSVCLLLVLRELEKAWNLKLSAIHVEHGIRGEESKKDEQFVRELCARLHLELQCKSVDVKTYAQENKLGIEEAARSLRYQYFEEVAKQSAGRCKIAIAHHMEDNAETVLFQMIRGSGMQGLCGMSPVREEDEVTYIRPLLAVSRKEIEAFLKAHEQDYCVDATNTDLEYSRNRIRNVILPELTQVNSQAILHINQAAGRIRKIQEDVMAVADKYAEQVYEKHDSAVVFHIDELKRTPESYRAEVVRKALFEVAGKKKDIGAIHVEAILELMDKQSGKQIDLPYHMVAFREYGRICLQRTVVEEPEPIPENQGGIGVTQELLEELMQLCLESGEGCTRMELPSGKSVNLRLFSYSNLRDEISKKPYTKWFDYDKIKSGFVIRKRCSGDYFVADGQGHTKKLKEYFINEKVPAVLRNQIDLMAIDSEIIWIVGKRISEKYKVTYGTKYVLEIQYNGGIL